MVLSQPRGSTEEFGSPNCLESEGFLAEGQDQESRKLSRQVG